MTRFARVGKKTSLDATPWHKLIAPLGNNNFQKRDKSAGKDITKSEDKKHKKLGKKRKICSEEGGDVASKTSKMSDREEHQNVNLDNVHSESRHKMKDVRKKRERTMKRTSECRLKELTISEESKQRKLGEKRKSCSMINENEGIGFNSFMMSENKEYQSLKSENAQSILSPKKTRTMNSKRHEKIMRKFSYGKKFEHSNTVWNRKKGASTMKSTSGALNKKQEARRKRRAKGKACFHCRQTGHLVSDCPMANSVETGFGVCYRCGCSEHTTAHCSKVANKGENNFPFAKCFICGETGHIARACPDNPKGLYPNGGACKLCGSVEHFRRDCPNMMHQRKPKVATTQLNNNKRGHCSADAQQEEDEKTRQKTPAKRCERGPRIVKF